MKREYYLTQPAEVAKFHAIRAAKGLPASETSWIDVCARLAAGDADLFDALWSFWNFAHAFDDLIDESGARPEQAEIIMTGLHDAVVYALLREGAGYNLTGLLKNFAAAAHWEKPKRELMIEAAADFFSSLYSNRFIREHAAEIRCVYVQAMTRSLDGEAMAKSDDDNKRAVAPAVRCGDLDALFHMVYLRRGWSALRACGAIREYDLPDGVPVTIRKEAV